jgi:hypothetical protein
MRSVNHLSASSWNASSLLPSSETQSGDRILFAHIYECERSDGQTITESIN